MDTPRHIPQCPICGHMADLMHIASYRIVYMECQKCHLSTFQLYPPPGNTDCISLAAQGVIQDWINISETLKKWKGGQA